MVETQRAECARSGTRGENPGVNNTQVRNESHLPNSSAQGPSGHSGPDMQQTDESLLSSSTDLHKGEEVERVSKVLVTACPKRVLRHPQNGDQDKVMEENDGRKEELRTKMVHLCNEIAEYGIQFDRDPTATEIKNTINMIKKIK